MKGMRNSQDILKIKSKEENILETKQLMGG
jgi:hypothetical protein